MTSISAASSSSTITNGVSTSPGAPRRQPTRQATIGRSVHLPLETSRPAFSRDRCTVTLTHGDPDGFLRDADAAGHGREPKTYVVASDLSIESGYAVEWGIGTVLRDGDTMVLVSVQETDSKLDPEPGQPASDRVSKLRNQQERQALGYLLVRQVTSLLQRTKLHCRVICMAVHAKNSRRLLLDLIDYIDPTMVIVGSRGRGQLKGILLGSTSHYLIQKSSVPVMVARRRLRRPARKTAHLQMQRLQPGSTYLSGRKSKLTEALIDKAGPGKVDVDVEHMREEMEREETEEVATRARVGGLREGVGSLGVQGGVGGAVENGDL
ncbi:adenine nucleotide alpha hydrolases-like protein [Clavulina sp. PMI_390]|nr:adenine nucleotide alpha hydrolases-like protein [Clavulina sp. PMI_390]